MPNEGQMARLRRRVLNRDGHRCQICGGPANEIDHIRPVMLGGADTDANLRAVCRPCNLRKGIKPQGPAVPQGDDPDCVHCQIGKQRTDGLCRTCKDYRKRTGVLPPPAVVARRLDLLVAHSNRGDGQWIMGASTGRSGRLEI
jgi:hypothetical protein